MAGDLSTEMCICNGSSHLKRCSASASPHALLLPYPAQGHINPFMQLGKRLAAQGVRVTLANIEHIHAKMVRSQQQQLALCNSSSQPLVNDNFHLLGIPDGLPPDFDRASWGEEMQKVIDQTLEEGALELVHRLALQGRPVTCIVGDFFLRWTCSLAERAALPEFVFWPQGASIFSIYLHVDSIISSGYDPFQNNVPVAVSREAPPLDLISGCIPGLPMGIHPADLPFECPLGKVILQWMHDIMIIRFSRMREAEGVIVNSFEALEPEVWRALTLEFQKGEPHPQYGRCWPARSIRLVGPLVPNIPSVLVGDPNNIVVATSGASFWREEVEECRQWLDSQPASSVLFVAFGSLMPITVAQVQELALGLAASGHRFLWVIREDAIRAAPIDGFSAAKRPDSVPLQEALPQGFLELNQHVCKVVSWAPQAMVLSHPSVGGFFSHCGWNSTLESICSGVPLLGWPWLMDQATNCWLASNVWKVGLTLERDEKNETSKMHVERGVRQLMEGALSRSLRASAKELRDLALAEAGSLRSDGFLSLVDDIVHLAKSNAKVMGHGQSSNSMGDH